uniref:Uncharacterized protein n=1 Tax=Cacopsylla melanoneura TaxID=428564 RepID=A0A8D8ZH61_9HEMI
MRPGVNPLLGPASVCRALLDHCVRTVVLLVHMVYLALTSVCVRTVEHVIQRTGNVIVHPVGRAQFVVHRVTRVHGVRGVLGRASVTMERDVTRSRASASVNQAMPDPSVWSCVVPDTGVYNVLITAHAQKPA